MPNSITPQSLRDARETDRLEALRNYQILDTPPEEVFDDLAKLAACICGTPISLVSLIDADRQWFKANVGLEGVESTEREISFCQHAMFGTDIYEVEDAGKDPLFSSNPLVVNDPGIRFYAGAPLMTPDGQPLGTLCAIDRVPRRLTEQQREALRILAREVVAHLELRRARLQLEQEQRKLDGLLRMANDAADSLYMVSRNELFIKQDHKLVRVSAADIRYVEALGDYVNIYAGRDRHTVYSTMKELETKLPPASLPGCTASTSCASTGLWPLRPMRWSWIPAAGPKASATYYPSQSGVLIKQACLIV
ncbi:GAF domain-containing protein [Hymenobacter cellulosilyticus]|uniref:GAF domain-containing DNA-binding protein n=1 Tax=Hymenobacter cellulosilyticus TaxID=2932248 RepID=A0A8T9Q4Z0_9BACT|nr:GAF domain-containing DNA-binding protein [Hymenobacter cellulosilyticus]UOQ72644.1 GAF domain-containing DNA-binding protein [Hymenobacter cellulosilyticus]